METIAHRLEDDTEGMGDDPVSVMVCDASLSMGIDEPDAQFVLELAEDRGAETPYRIGPPAPEHQSALRALGQLMLRYVDGEFMPPPSYFGIKTPEA